MPVTVSPMPAEDGAHASSSSQPVRPRRGVGEVTRRAARTIAASVVAETIGKVGTFLFVLIGARSLTKDEFGAFSYALAAATLLAAIPQWGFDSVIVREASREPRRLPVLMGETWIWRLLLTLPVIIGAALFGALTRPDVESEAAFVIVVGATLLDALTQTGRAAGVSRQSYGGVAFAHIVQRLTTAVLGAAALAAGFELVGFSSALLLGSVIGTVGVWMAVRRLGVRVDFRGVTRRGLAVLGRESLPLGLDLVLAMAVLRLDAVLLGSIKGDSAVATSVVTRVVETVLFLAWAAQHGLFPVMSAADVGWRVRVAIERGLALVAAGYVPFLVIMALRGGAVVGLLFGSQYRGPAVDPAAWLAAAPLLIALGNLLTHALIAQRRSRQVVIGTLLALVVNIALNVVLIPSHGPEGAAAATTVAYLVENLLLMYYCARSVGTPRLDVALAPALCAGVAMAAVMLVVPGGPAIEIALGTVTFLLAWLALTYRFAPENLELLRSMLRRTQPEDVSTPSALDDL